MASAITHFRIEGLHGERTIDVPITENRLIIVGENGTGKSTVVTLLFYFLTRQWSRITSHEFKSISATIGGEEVAITRDDVSQWSSILHDDEWLSIASRRAVDLILRDNTINADASDGKLQRDAVMRLVAEHDLPPSAFLDAMRLLERRDAKVPESVKDAERVIGNAALGEVLFLPTYRRIEQDLRAIFPGSSSEMRAFRERASHRPRRQGYVELVEFGMEDVESNIQSKMNQIKEYIRSGLTNLTARYLRDVIRGEYESVEYSAIASVDDSTIDAIFSRIQESILSSAEQDRLRDIVDKIKGDSDILSGEKIVAHFLDRLIKL